MGNPTGAIALKFVHSFGGDIMIIGRSRES